MAAWPLRRKVALALAVPLLLAGSFGALRVSGDLVEASNSSAGARQVTALRPAVDYLVAAEKAMVAAVSTENADRSALPVALVEVRAAGEALLDSKESADLTAHQRYQVDAVLDLSQSLRAEDAAALSPGTWVAQLRQLQSGVTQLITTIVNDQIDPEPRLELLSQALAGRFSLAMQQALAATERTGETGSLELFSELGVEGAAIDRLAAALGTSEAAVASLRTANAQRFREVRTGGTDLGGPDAYADYDRLISSLQDGIDEQLEAAAAEARTDALLDAAVTLAALVAAVMLALLVSRLLLDPIRRVREGTLAVAHERLPDAVARIRAGEDPGEITPIDVSTEEEIGQLARAVDDMHRQAVVLASGEASLRAQVSQMFVTLSRRSTSLVNQQLGLIEQLERDEEDPKRLESLFRLDHLAARMRRTADSLLILADAPSAHTVVGGLSVSDALQAATSGVQDYQRVRLRSTNPVRVDESAAADVVHLLTELVDNALTYSPPGSEVTIGSRTTAQGVVVEITDAGLGIAPDELETLNASLRSGGEVTPDTARRMGLLVVGRLSRRHGLTTTLHANPDGGTTAEVVLPPAVLPELAPPPVVAPPKESPAAAPKAPATPKPERRPTAKPDRKPARKPEPVPTRDATQAPMDLEDWINAALGLPTRLPGINGNGPASAAPPPVTPSTAPAALAALRPLGKDVGESPRPARPEPEQAGEARTELPTRTRPTVEAAPTPESPSVSVAEPEAEAAPGPEPLGKVEEALRTEPARTVPTTPPSPPAVTTALDEAWTDPGGDGADTPIFRTLRSAWLTSGDDAQPWRTSEIEAGWERVDQVVETDATSEVSESGLPVRRPGRRLVPGGVTKAPAATVRDPEAVRARLAAHASGVSRGRAAARTTPTPTAVSTAVPSPDPS